MFYLHGVNNLGVCSPSPIRARVLWGLKPLHVCEFDFHLNIHNLNARNVDHALLKFNKHNLVKSIMQTQNNLSKD